MTQALNIESLPGAQLAIVANAGNQLFYMAAAESRQVSIESSL